MQTFHTPVDDPDLVSVSGQQRLSSGMAPQRLNAVLAHAVHQMDPIRLRDLSIVIQHAHFGPGLYPTGMSYRTHRHHDFQIEYILSGRFGFEINGEPCLLEPRQGVIIPPWASHQWETLEGGLMLGVMLKVGGEGRENLLEQFTEALSQGVPRFEPDSCAFYLQQLVEAFLVDPGHPFLEMRMSCWIELWLMHALEAVINLNMWQPESENFKVDRLDRGSEICRRAIEFMEANYAEAIKLEDIATQVGISARHLNRIFRQHHKESVNNKLMQIRLNHAFEMLAEDPDRPVKEVSYALGFSSPSYFTHCFKRAYGFLPKSIR